MPTFEMSKTFETPGRSIPYEIVRRPRRRQPAIQVDRDGHVRVLVPSGFDESRIPALLSAHEGWLERHVLERPPERHTFSDGERFLLLGEPMMLQLCSKGVGPGLAMSEGAVIKVLASDGPGQIREALIGWYAKEASRDLTARVKRLAPVVGRLPAQLRVRDYRSRWGYCRTDGVIAFNWRLIQAPPGVIDYVVVHEMAHLHHPHHQLPFWELVRSVAGDVRDERRWLRENDRALHW